ncbi:MAG TPA: disulfide bond formation protein B [Methylocella sp.]|nr:disulfide bond formation protein B [Methylocella sp.]
MSFNRPLFLALTVFAIAAASIAGALIFEALGYAPCELCLKERIPYYAGIALSGLAAAFAAWGKARFLRAAFFALALIFAGSAVFGAYHAGVEWGFWPGPQACSGVLKRAETVAEFLAQLENVKVVRCDAPALTILGLSLAGWNALISAGLSALSLAGLSANNARSRARLIPQ